MTPSLTDFGRRLLEQPGAAAKLGAGAALALIPGANLLALGYLYRWVAGLRAGHGLGLPEWTDWRGLLLDGLRFLLVYGLYALVPWAALAAVCHFLAQLPLVPGAALFGQVPAALWFAASPALVTAGLAVYLDFGQPRALLRFDDVLGRLRLLGAGAVVPSLALAGLLGAALAGWPSVFGYVLFQAAHFGGLVVVLGYLSALLASAERQPSAY